MNNRVSLIIFLTLVCHVFVFAQNPSGIERKQLFDDSWKFFLGDTAAAGSNNFDDGSWRTIDLPHDWSIEGQVSPKNPTRGSGGYFPAGVGWYRKSFKVPNEWKGKSISIYFEGVYMNSEVIINGQSLGIRPYGYSSFSYDLSPYLNPGHENVIAVRVDNSKQVNSRWYSGSGIYRHVWMVVTDLVHVANWGVEITTPDVSSKRAAVEIKTLVKNETGSSQNIVLKTKIHGANSSNIVYDQIKVQLSPNSEKEVVQTVGVSNPLLWTPETPDLYMAEVEVLKGNKIIDETKTNFGIRSLNFTSAGGLRLNGRTVKIDGGCVHHDNGCLGAAAFDRAEERKIGLLKSAGFNAVRTSHNPPSEAFLNACDRLGLLVIDEALDCWRAGKNKQDYAVYFDQWWRRDLETMVFRDINHPSIIMWSIGNEIVERGTPEAVRTAKMLAGAIKKIDSTRPITSAVVENGKDWSVLDSLMAAHDVAGYNYHLNSAPSDHQRVPGRIILQTESYPKDAFSNWKLVQNSNYIIGDCVWTAMDYLGESGIGRWYYSGDTPGEHWENDLFPWHGAYCGDIDGIGWRKPISHYRNLLYNNTEKLYMAVREPELEPLEIKGTWWSVWPTWESWTWPGLDGKNIQVEVYSRYRSVRLYLNETLIGEKSTTEEEEYKATFSVPYSQGVVKAVGVENGKEVESTILRTAGEAAKIRLTADKKELAANGQDLIYVTVEITDKDGVFQPNAASRLNFKIDGPGMIAGVDNADMKDTDKYAADNRKTWHGRALVVIRSTHSAGEVKLRVTSPGLSDASLNIESGVSEPGSNLPPEKMQWWEDQKFGMFIHWGLYAIPATGEWTMFNQKIPAEEYAKLADQFDPKHFSATEWAKVAKEAGMKYMVMVARHHDGFALWNSPSSYRHFDSWETTAHRDFIKEYTDACRKAGLYVGIYYSPLDWRFPGYFDPKGIPDNAALLKKQTYGQVEELMKNYGKIDILWYDGGWLAHKGTDADAAWFWEPLKLNAMVRSYNPDVVINPRSGMVGDFQTDEGGAEVRGPIIPFPWEKCLNLNAASWGYNKTQQLMPLKRIIDMLVNTVDRGGNLLLNVGPDPDGVIPPAHVERLKEVGKWLAKNGESIYQTRPGPFQPVDYSYGATYRGNKIYIHLLKIPAGPAVIKLPPTKQIITACRVLHGKEIEFHQGTTGITLNLATVRLDSLVTPLVLKTKDR